MNTNPEQTHVLGNKVPKIMVFDSGVGGLSIVEAIRRRLPFCDQIFACDNAAFPYGTKDEGELLQRVDSTLQAFIDDQQPDIVVVACNTASTLVLPRIRSRFKLPIVGVVPAIKPAAEKSKSKVIGLLATPGTIDRPYTNELIKQFARGCKVIKVGSSQLVGFSESALRGTSPDQGAIKQIIAPFFAHPELDSIVLACTHFPLLGDDLRKNASRDILWIDSGEAIARRVESLLTAHIGQPRSGDREDKQRAIRGQVKAIFTKGGSNSDVELLLPALRNLHCEELNYLTIEV